MKLIDKDALVAEIKKINKEIGIPPQKNSCGEEWFFEAGEQHVCHKIYYFINTLEVKEVDLDAYTKASKALSVAFMQFLDNIRPEGKMCLSNAECFDIERAFAMMDYSKLLRYIEKYSTI